MSRVYHSVTFKVSRHDITTTTFSLGHLVTLSSAGPSMCSHMWPPSRVYCPFTLSLCHLLFFSPCHLLASLPCHLAVCVSPLPPRTCQTKHVQSDAAFIIHRYLALFSFWSSCHLLASSTLSLCDPLTLSLFNLIVFSTSHLESCQTKHGQPYTFETLSRFYVAFSSYDL